ncbi:MAG: molybdopterin-dependent oxidoreductase [Proteobacteria bacterium]|nr:molybdopterin-dependent oxidoreductase [Pseudomonadota bacterium]
MDLKFSSCYFCSSRGCAVKVYLEDGRIKRVTVDTRAPVVPGGHCVRPALAKAYQEHPFRLDFPMKRKGARGEGRWEPIPWDQALDEIAGKLADLKARYGPETIATSSGTGRGAWEFAKTRFMNLFGSPNRFGAVTVCYGPRIMVWLATFGGTLVADRREGVTRLVTLWGRNPHEGGPHTWHSFLKAKKAGIATMVVDSRFTEPARQADLWVPIRPGTDAALALGMMHIILREGWHDAGFVENFTVGFEDLKKRVRDYPPERVCSICGLSPEKLVDTARFFAARQPSNITIGVASEHSPPNSIQAVRAINVLLAVCGSVDTPGGMLIASPSEGFITDAAMELNEALPDEQRAKQIGADRFRFLSYPGWELVEREVRKKWGENHPAGVYLTCMAHAPLTFRAMLTGKPYPVRGLLVSGSNPLLAYANTKLVYEALMSLDLLVTLDLTWTPTAGISDYVLPAACWLERPDMGNFSSIGAYPLVQLGEAALPAFVDGRYDRYDDYRFWRELGCRLGQEGSWPQETFDQVWEYRMEKIFRERNVESVAGFVRQKRWEKGQVEAGVCAGGLATASGKVEIKSSVLQALGYDPLPSYTEPQEPEGEWKKYPLLNLSGVRTMPYHHSEYRHVEEFRRMHPDPIVEIPVDTARKKGIVDGDWVWIETPVGRCRQRARLVTTLPPDCITTQHGWWFPEKPAASPSLYGLWESNINLTTDDDPEKCDPISGGWPFKGQYMRCRIRKAEEGRRKDEG